jgi:cell division septum initiation protein DivIVA
MDQVKKEIAQLKLEVSDLKTQYLSLRKAILKSAYEEQQPPAKPPAAEKKAEKPGPAVDEKELTKIICRAVGQFFVEADASLKASNSDIAKERMRSAFRKLNATLEGYSELHRVSKLLTIYEGVTWDTYVAVELMQSVQGNADFIAALNKHKQKYNETCPKE